MKISFFYSPEKQKPILKKKAKKHNPCILASIYIYIYRTIFKRCLLLIRAEKSFFFFFLLNNDSVMSDLKVRD